MICLIYVSSATGRLDEAALAEILDVSRRKNAEAGITGLLMYSGGNIPQAIEGEEAAVGALFDRIKTDPRHRGIQKMMAFPIEKRQFPNWAMAVKRPQDLPAPYTASSIKDVQQALTEPGSAELSQRLRMLVRVFAEGMR